MDNQNLLNSIATLSGTIDPLIRAKDIPAIETVSKKIVELVGLIKIDSDKKTA